MLSACEDCLFLYPADMKACPACSHEADWLTQTYDLDAPHVCMSCDSASSAEAVK